jgi:hypothetical protein
VCRSTLPWIDQLNVHRLEIRGVSGDDLQAMDQRSRGDQCVALRPRIGHVQTRATLRDCYIHRKHTSGEGCRAKDTAAKAGRVKRYVLGARLAQHFADGGAACHKSPIDVVM